MVCGFLKFWLACGKKQCQRAKTCTGNGDVCFKRFWPIVPEKVKIFVREAVKCSVAGLTKPEISANITRAQEFWDKNEAAAEADRASWGQAPLNK